MIPQDKLEPVTRALREAFAVTEVEDIDAITKGRSKALVYRVIVRGTPFLLRIIMRTEDPTLPHHFACMKIAADAGLAPRVLYTSMEDRLSITDFVKTAPFSMKDALVRMPATLRALHALPPFPKRADELNTSCTFLLNKGVAAEGFIQRVRAANIFPAREGAELFARFEQIVAAYSRRESDMVSSHNDLFKPDNILFDGSRIWLVDWEAAFLNDRYADLAVVANMVAGGDDEEKAFLQEYLGEAPDEDQSARLFLMRQLAHAFYAMGFLLLGSHGTSINWSERVPEFKDLRRQVWLGEVNMADGPSKIVYGRANLEQLLENVSRARFTESLRIVSPGKSAVQRN